MRAKKLAEHSSIPKSLRYCPRCDNITVYGYNTKTNHSHCTICGSISLKAKFVRWCNPRIVIPEWQKRNPQLTKQQIKNIMLRNKNKTKNTQCTCDYENICDYHKGLDE